ncbi:NAD(P)/FAD-dependent oxidoreductase [Nevskia sp.]|uniref:NAD(P)/FAD-dependent oxidoreductase n=1 Tax=Nevskia sp. TaxID=1929292 RepID=UPI0025F778FA|nr:NAD(P)/FAD-dependent oxidoreductase [Nevskia sp.]
MSPLPRIVIVGAGFGGLTAARALDGLAVDLTVVDRRNFHLFQPLLYQVATAGLNPSDVAWPVRGILSRQKNARVLLGEVTSIDAATREVLLSDGRKLAYDWLILATGATHTYFGNDQWERHAPGLKRVDDATLIRRRLLLALERAENSGDPAEQKKLMTFAIVGAGPTGVELAGAIAELSKKVLIHDFRAINTRDVRVVLVEGADRVLLSFPPTLSAFALAELEKKGVEVMLNTRVTGCDADGLSFGDGSKLDAATVLWAAGVAASPAARWLNVPADRAGRVQVLPDLGVPGHERVFVIGDTAAIVQNGKQVPGVAPAAKQQGQHVAKTIRAALAGKKAPGPFKYRDFGNLATIGRHSAVIDFGFLRMKGLIAWWLWGIAHVYFLIGARNRSLVATQWFFNYLSYSRAARLIVGTDEDYKEIR